jgi:hypothetical protein
MLLIVGFIYKEYGNEIAFSPSVFFTEFFKFLAITVCWTIILEFYRKSGSEKKNRLLIEFLLISKIKELLLKLDGNLHENELSLGIALIIDNISLIKTHSTISPKSLKLLSEFENNIKNKEFVEAMKYIELQVKNHSFYKETPPYKIIINKLTNLISCI